MDGRIVGTARPGPQVTVTIPRITTRRPAPTGRTCIVPVIRIRRFSHACVRLETRLGTTVIDPGEWSEPEATVGVDAVLLTHLHSDHFDASKLAGFNAPMFSPEPVPDHVATQVRDGDSVAAAGATIRVVGGEHAQVVPSVPLEPNVGYLVPGEWYHPGDSLFVPDEPIRLLFLPMQASWLKTSEAIDFANSVSPEIAIGIHEAQLNERGIRAINSWFAERCRCSYSWMPPGTSMEWSLTD